MWVAHPRSHPRPEAGRGWFGEGREGVAYVRLFQSCFSYLGVVRSLGEPAAPGISAPPFHRASFASISLGVEL